MLLNWKSRLGMIRIFLLVSLAVRLVTVSTFAQSAGENSAKWVVEIQKSLMQTLSATNSVSDDELTDPKKIQDYLVKRLDEVLLLGQAREAGYEIRFSSLISWAKESRGKQVPDDQDRMFVGPQKDAQENIDLFKKLRNDVATLKGKRLKNSIQDENNSKEGTIDWIAASQVSTSKYLLATTELPSDDILSNVDKTNEYLIVRLEKILLLAQAREAGFKIRFKSLEEWAMDNRGYLIRADQKNVFTSLEVEARKFRDQYKGLREQLNSLKEKMKKFTRADQSEKAKASLTVPAGRLATLCTTQSGSTIESIYSAAK